MGDYSEMDEQALRAQLSEAPNWKARQTIRRALSTVIHLQRHKPQTDDVPSHHYRDGRRRSSVTASSLPSGRRQSVVAQEEAQRPRSGRRRSSVVPPASAGDPQRRPSSAGQTRRRSSVATADIKYMKQVGKGPPNNTEERLARRRSSVVTPDLENDTRNKTQGAQRRSSVSAKTSRRPSSAHCGTRDFNQSDSQSHTKESSRPSRPLSEWTPRRNSIVKDTQSSANRRSFNPPATPRRAWDPPTTSTRRNSLLALSQRKLVSGGPKTEVSQTSVRTRGRVEDKTQPLHAVITDRENSKPVGRSSPDEEAVIENGERTTSPKTFSIDDKSPRQTDKENEDRLSSLHITDEKHDVINQPRLRGFRTTQSRRRSSQLADIKESPHEISRLREISERGGGVRSSTHGVSNNTRTERRNSKPSLPGSSYPKKNGGKGGVDYSAIRDERQLENMLNEASDYWERKKIRGALSDLRRLGLASTAPDESHVRHTQTVQIQLKPKADEQTDQPTQSAACKLKARVSTLTSAESGSLQKYRSQDPVVPEKSTSDTSDVSKPSSHKQTTNIPPTINSKNSLGIVRQNSLGNVLNTLIANSKMEEQKKPKPRIVSLGRSQSMKAPVDHLKNGAHYRRPLFRDLACDPQAKITNPRLDGKPKISRLETLSPEAVEAPGLPITIRDGGLLDTVEETKDATKDSAFEAPSTDDVRTEGIVRACSDADTVTRPSSLHLIHTNSTANQPCDSTQDSKKSSVVTEYELTSSNNKSGYIRTVVSKSRSASQSEYTTKDSLSQIKSLSPSGNEVFEQEKVTTRRKFTRQGSEYIQTECVRSKVVSSNGGQFVKGGTEITVEKDSSSVTSGECSSETMHAQIMNSPHLVMLEEESSQSESECESDTHKLLSHAGQKGCPNITKALEEQVANDGGSVTFSCGISGMSLDEAEVVWYRGEKLLSETDGFLQTFANGEASLHMSEVFPDDEGVYECSVKTDKGTAQSAARLRVITQDLSSDTPPSFTKRLCDLTVEVMQDAVFECHVEDEAELSITWYRGAVVISDLEGVYEMEHEGDVARLRVCSVLTSDRGSYSCSVKNAAGEVRCAAVLTVKDCVRSKAPCLRKALRDSSVEEGQTISLSCCVSGFPTPTVSWYLDTQKAPDNEEFIQTYDGRVATLTLDEAYEDDQGEFTCVAENKAGKASSSCFLIIKAPCSKPEFITPLKPVAVKVGQCVTLSCTVRGQPAPVISWYLDEHLLPQGEEFKQSFDGSQASLTLAEVYEDDEGEFMCVAKNDAGSANSKALLTVDDGPPEVPPDITDQLADAEGEEGRPLTLSCRVMGHPVPMVLWYRNNDLLRSGVEYKQRYEGDRATLRIRELFPQDTGRYSCVARNNLGKASTECKVSIKGQEKESCVLIANSDDENATMSSVNIEEIDDEDVLHKLMNQTDNFEERKKIRARMRNLREKRAAEFEKAKNEREQQREDAVSLRQRQAAEARARKMADYEEKAKAGKQDAGIVEQNIRERQARAEEEKKQKLEKYKEMAKTQAQSYHAIGDSIRKAEQAASEAFKEKRLQTFDEQEKSPGGQRLAGPQKAQDGKTRHITSVGGFGGTAYSLKPESPESTAKRFADMFSNKASSTTSGIVNVTTESWNSKDGIIKRTEKSQVWGGARGAANMFKKMDASNAPPGGARPNRKPRGDTRSVVEIKREILDFVNAKIKDYEAISKFVNPLQTNSPVALDTFDNKCRLCMASYLPGPSAGRGGGVGVQRSPSAIKQMLLDWCKAQVAGYENVNVTNFSSSWNDGMAFCALIHHFFPDAFDFSTLNPKNRRGNFQLAFDTAEQKADIAPLLEVDDMVRFKNPDWKCVFCYVQSLYRNLRSRDQASNPPTPSQ